jgi:hypothetical protein
VSGGGTGVVSHAGLALLRRLADVTELTAGFSRALAGRRLMVMRIRTWPYNVARYGKPHYEPRPLGPQETAVSAFLSLLVDAYAGGGPFHPLPLEGVISVLIRM